MVLFSEQRPAPQPPAGRREGKSELDQDNDPNAPQRAEYAKGECCRIKLLREYDPPLYSVPFLMAHVLMQEALSGRVPPTCVEAHPQQQKIHPENRQGDAQMNKVFL